MKSNHRTVTVPLPATITGRRELSGDTTLFSLQLGGGEAARSFAFAPGQFIQLSVPGSGEAPISLASPPSDTGAIELCVKRVGHLTEMLHELGIGSRLGIRGPYGNGFPVTAWQGKNVLLIAGGLGIAPLRSLLYFLLSRPDEYGTITVTYGAREPSALLFKEELAELGARSDMRLFLTVDLATDEPPLGLVCNTGLLPELLGEVAIAARNTVAAVCGPPALYRCVIDELQGFGFSPDAIFLSLERQMKCGIGLCCHCAFGNLFCCTDGPVFRYADIQGIKGAL